MNNSRARPSGRYHEMLAQYRALHENGEQYLGLEADSTYPGVSLLPHVSRIKALIEATGATTILDYGCGKGYQYDLHPVRIPDLGEVESVIDYWDIDEVRCYDPCYKPHSKRPEGRFGGVVCTDVLEHCLAEDIPWIVEELFSYAERFVFASVACYPAKSRLPNGENAHCTIRPLEWWRDVFATTGAHFPTVKWKLFVEAKPGSVHSVRADDGHGEG